MSFIDTLQNFSDKYQSLLSLPPISIISTILAIFLGNTLLRKIAEQKEKKEVAILFENTIETHLKFIGFIDCYLRSSELHSNEIQEVENLKNFIDIYLSQLKDDVYYETAFKKIGIYSGNEIDCISLYSSEKQLFIGYLKRLLIRLDNLIVTQKNNIINIPEAKLDFNNILEIATFSSLKTQFLATLCLLIFSVYSNSEKQLVYQHQQELQSISDKLRDSSNSKNVYRNELKVIKLKIENLPQKIRENIKNNLLFISVNDD